jgi:hypothetical protein
MAWVFTINQISVPSLDLCGDSVTGVPVRNSNRAEAADEIYARYAVGNTRRWRRVVTEFTDRKAYVKGSAILRAARTYSGAEPTHVSSQV